MSAPYEYELVGIESITPYEHNPRTHSDTQISQLRASIREFGFTNPLLIDDQHRLIAGHGRLLAAQAEGMQQVPAIIVTGLSDTQRRALVIADNKHAMNAGWNENLLAIEMKALESFDVATIGFRASEVAALLKCIDANALPELSSAFKYRLVVDCPNEQVQADLMKRLEAEGFSCRPLVS